MTKLKSDQNKNWPNGKVTKIKIDQIKNWPKWKLIKVFHVDGPWVWIPCRVFFFSFFLQSFIQFFPTFKYVIAHTSIKMSIIGALYDVIEQFFFLRWITWVSKPKGSISQKPYRAYVQTLIWPFHRWWTASFSLIVYRTLS